MVLAVRVRLILFFIFAILFIAGLAGSALAHAQSQPQAEPPAPHVLVIKVDGIINDVKTRYIERAITLALEDQAELIVMELDTPGGLLSSTRSIVELLLESPAPMAVYVSPKGARAGSAGTFLTAAGHFAVMAPGTNIGAATPVSATGEELDETLASKIENDAAALIRSIAQERGRNEDALERTVREAASFTATEALELDIVDFIAEDLEDLLAQLDRRSVQVSGEDQKRVLATRDLDIRRLDKNVLENFLEFISDPNVSFILLTIGGLGIVVELFNPGLIAPGVVGAICLMLAFLALGNLPVNWAGAAFIILAVLLAVLETQVSGFGILGAGSIVSVLVGGLLLFNQFGDVSPTLPEVSVSRWLLAGTAGVLAAGLIFVGWEIYTSRRRGREPSHPSLVGQEATVTRELAPRGVVRLENETWTADSRDGNVIPAGESVTVVAVDGLILTVARPPNTNNQP
ncbi:MAG: nodulation protein NfeD [Chloroflexi bacterium]|nr:nodulation protein NfeD [Chloroflexota bacterium]